MVGRFVIVNHCDRPCAQLVARVIENVTINGVQMVRCRYLNAVHGTAIDRVDNVTPVEEFGVRVTKVRGGWRVRRTGESCAKYPDGGDRKWQGFDDETIATSASSKKSRQSL